MKSETLAHSATGDQRLESPRTGTAAQQPRYGALPCSVADRWLPR